MHVNALLCYNRLNFSFQ